MENKQFFDSVPLLTNLNQSQKDSLLNALSTLKYNPGDRIVKEGDPGDLFFIIKEGEVVCTKDNREIRRMGRGDFFGE